MDQQDYDGIVIGGGHNGLILAAYLARAGLRVLVLERQIEVGGGLDTHEDVRAPGFYHNVHSVFHRMVTDLPWYRDLELDGLGCRYVRPDVGCAHLFSDGRAILWHSDVERTAASIARFSPHDAQTYRQLRQEWAPIVRDIVTPETYHAPLPYAEKAALLETSAVGREYLQLAALSPVEVVDEYFRDEQLKAMLLYLGVMRGYDIYSRGLGYLIPVQVVTGVNPQLCVGSSHQLAHFLEEAVWHAGGEVRERSRVVRLLIEGGRATGVELWDGSTIRARRFVASSIDPHQTFLDLAGAEHLAPEFAARVKAFRYSLVGPIFALNLSLSERPVYRNEAYDPDVGRALLTIIGLDHSDDIAELYRAHREGWLPRKLFFNGTTPTVFDPSQAPPGKHTAFMWPLLPYHLKDGGPARWDEVKEQFFDLYLARWREFAPNLNAANIVSRGCSTPLDIERHLPNMVGGDWMVGEMNTEQCLDKRPLPELSSHRTPIGNLYLCGSCCHPGGNITGAPGYNAARVIAHDLGLRPWWQPHDVHQRWEKLR